MVGRDTLGEARRRRSGQRHETTSVDGSDDPGQHLSVISSTILMCGGGDGCRGDDDDMMVSMPIYCEWSPCFEHVERLCRTVQASSRTRTRWSRRAGWAPTSWCDCCRPTRGRTTAPCGRLWTAYSSDWTRLAFSVVVIVVVVASAAAGVCVGVAVAVPPARFGIFLSVAG